MEILCEFHEKRGGTLLIVTHDFAIGGYGHTQVFLKDGQIVSRSEAFGNK
jgi:ABC-type antimicrobial peptide transport system, ATPase component